ncbi:MAG: valine--tRNA ligase [Leptospiraceae bacterium]|nr:valine--tRNA ligase [Leptospiraceae bacterium]
MQKLISDRYEPHSVEQKWIEIWENNSSFSPNLEKSDNFSIVIPPPNVTGTLHIGHALNHTIQDIIIRIERKKGKATLWVPGMDHAGIATQMVVERELNKENKKRTDFTRNEFENKVWEWKKLSGGKITHQQRMLGESVDWSHERFTMDEGLSKAVTKVFKTLYDEGLIYRGEKIINWCPATQTAISDIEVEFKETKGFLYHIKYPIKNSSEYIVVATTRPETLFGDMAVCAHPNDSRYNQKKDVMLHLPLTEREIPLLFDEFVDKEFGSGLVKITPAHDANDFEAGFRLGLKPLKIMSPNATLNENTGKYNGLDRFVARKKVVEDLESLGLIEKIEDYTNSVGHNQRGGAVIEPYLSTQWFVKIKPLAEPAIEAVKSGRVEFIPKMWEKTYYEWMENIRDWCISRQLWWGHRIPAYYCGECGHTEVAEEKVDTCPKCGSDKMKQDTDVLDTWFSSGLWAFSVYGWPDKTDDLKRFYPNSILVTGFDIIFFWVARMIMLGLKFQNDVPFHKVLIHGLVRDKYGKKFSKTAGNTVDPLEMMNVYGTDSFRFFLTATMPKGRDVLFDVSRLDGYRSFCNKVWNSSRFILMNLPTDFAIKDLDMKSLEPTDKWILTRFNNCLTKYEQAYKEYSFYDMASVIYSFIWGDFCDWYIELTKTRIYNSTNEESKQKALNTLVSVLLSSLNLLHPFMPFITEEINSAFSDEILTTSSWSDLYDLGEKEETSKIDLLIEIVTQIRTVRSELHVPPDKKCKIILKTQDKLTFSLIQDERASILGLAKADSLELDSDYTVSQTDAHTSFSKGEIFLPLSGMLDLEKEKSRLQKEKDSLEKELAKVGGKIGNSEFLSKAKPEIIEKEKAKFSQLEEKLSVVKKGLEKF